MSWTSLVLIIASVTIYLLKAIVFIYIFQIKEYRWDRFWSILKEQGFVNLVYLHPLKLPAKKMRNLLITIITLVLAGMYGLFLAAQSLVQQTVWLVLTPIVALCNTLVLVWLTSIFAFISRTKIIRAAQNKLKKSRTVFIGVTGSFGKTTCKEFLFTLLSQKYRVGKTKANQNTNVGVALSVLRSLKANTDYFIAEMGAYKRGEIKKTVSLINPKYGVITGISDQHLDLFGSSTNLLKAKKELVLALPELGKAYVNQEINNLPVLLQGLHCSVCLFSLQNKQVNIYASQIVYDPKKMLTKAKISYQQRNFVIQTPLLGQFNIELLLPAMALSLDLGVKQEGIVRAVKKLRPVQGRMNLIKGRQSTLIIDDSYNCSSEGFYSTIKVSKLLGRTKVIIVSKGIIELGKQKRNNYRQIVKEIAENQIRFFTTDSLFKKLDLNNAVTIFNNETEILKQLDRELGKETLIIVEGRFTDQFLKFFQP